MFKTIILSVNSKFIHTLLAPRYLVANINNYDCNSSINDFGCNNYYNGSVEIYETNINTSIYETVTDLYKLKPQIIAVSCYIFNIEYVIKVLKEIKVILPYVKIILGGYEAIFDTQRFDNISDVIIRGEGDIIFGQVLSAIECGDKVPHIVDGREIENLDRIISPYTEEYAKLGKDKILYFESSRGCPFSCSYCMSAGSNIRVFSLQRTFEDLERLMKYTPKQIKFVDRTFNFDMRRSEVIITHIIEKYVRTKTNFHFEAAPELFDEQLLQVIKKAPKGLFQFEVGVQSFNKETLTQVGRSANEQKILYNIQKLVECNNSHIHTDLIAGLPLENYESFVDGFDKLYMTKAHCLQLGFLKVLKGSRLEKNSGEYKISNFPPYEIFESAYLPLEKLLMLKITEETLELYHNSGRFNESLDFLIPKYFTPYEFFYNLGLFIKENNIIKTGFSAFYQCDILYNFSILKIKSIENTLISESKIELLKNKINNDFSISGNVRKWRR
ncbi:MAG: DUF4080 domain-containing protein [Clostridia bacterium]